MLDFSQISRSSLSIISAEIGSDQVLNQHLANNAVGTPQIAGSAVTVDKLNIDGHINMNEHQLWQCAEIRGGMLLTQHAINLASDYWVGYASGTDSRLTLTQDASLRGHTDLTVDAQAGDLRLKAGSEIKLQVASGQVATLKSIVKTDSVTLKVGHEGLMEFDVDGVLRYLAFREPS